MFALADQLELRLGVERAHVNKLFISIASFHAASVNFLSTLAASHLVLVGSSTH